MSILNFVSEVDIAHGQLSEAHNALSLLLEYMQAEGYQTEEDFQDTKAIVFALRFPAMLSTLSMIVRDMDNTLTELEAIVYEAYEENKTA